MGNPVVFLILRPLRNGKSGGVFDFAPLVK